MHIHDLRKLIRTSKVEKGKYYTLDTGEIYLGTSNSQAIFVRKNSSDIAEQAQDAIGSILENSDTIALTYIDGPPSIKATLISLTGFSTDDLNEGSSNLYWTQTRFDIAFAAKDTDDLAEGVTNLYFTQARARTSISETITGIDYNNGTGVFSLTAGYEIPTSAMLSGYISGTGANDRIALWSGASTQDSDANFTWNGTTLLVGTNATLFDEVALFRRDQNSATYLAVINNTSGTAGRSSLFVSNSATLAQSLQIESISAAYTTSGIRIADSAVLITNKLAGLNIGTTNATNVAFWTNSTEKFRVLSTGEFLVGATAITLTDEVSTFRKDQNGSTWLTLVNNTSNTAARAGFIVSTSSTGSPNLSVQGLSAAYTTAGMRVADTGVIQSNFTGGLNIGTNGATSFRIWTNDAQRVEVNSSGFVGIGTASVSNAPITTSFAVNAAVIPRFINTSNGTGASSQLCVRNDGNVDVFMGIRSSGFTTAGLLVANQGQFIGATSIASMLYGTTSSADSIFIRGGSATTDEVARFSSTGFQTTNSKTIGINTAAVALQPISAVISTNTNMLSFIQNSSNGTAAISTFTVKNDTGANFGLAKYSSGFTTAGLLEATLGRLFTGTGNILIGPTGTASNIQFATSGTATTNLRLTIADTTITVADAINFVFNTTTGTKHGTATTQKQSFWNATPIVQPTTAIAAATFVANTSGIVNDTATFDGYTIGQVVKALRNIGLLA